MPESIGGGDGWRAHYIEGPLPPFDIHQDPTRFRHKYNLWGIVAALNNDLTMESFTPIQEVRDGERAYEEWGKLAREGQPFGCSAEDCVLIVNVVSPLGEMALAYCTMPKGGSGAPENCWQISVTRGGATWMLAKRGIIIPPGVGGDGEDDRILRLSGVESRAAYDALTRALSAPPLDLTTQVTSSGDIVGSAHKRRSNVLADYNEIATVRLEPRQVEGETQVTLITTLFLDPLNTTRNADYSRPEENLQEAYLKAILLAIRLSFFRPCPQGKWQGDNVFYCTPGAASKRGLTRLPDDPEPLNGGFVLPTVPPQLAPGAQLLGGAPRDPTVLVPGKKIRRDTQNGSHR